MMPDFTLEQLCRALAAHCLLSSHPGMLHEFLAPETAESTAKFILRFALGEPLERPSLKNEGCGKSHDDSKWRAPVTPTLDEIAAVIHKETGSFGLRKARKVAAAVLQLLEQKNPVNRQQTPGA